MMVLTIAGRNFSLKGGRIDTSVIARDAKAAVHTAAASEVLAARTTRLRSCAEAQHTTAFASTWHFARSSAQVWPEKVTGGRSAGLRMALRAPLARRALLLLAVSAPSVARGEAEAYPNHAIHNNENRIAWTNGCCDGDLIVIDFRDEQADGNGGEGTLHLNNTHPESYYIRCRSCPSARAHPPPPRPLAPTPTRAPRATQRSARLHVEDVRPVLRA